MPQRPRPGLHKKRPSTTSTEKASSKAVNHICTCCTTDQEKRVAHKKYAPRTQYSQPHMHALGTKIIRLAILTAVMAAMTVIAYAYHQQAHAQANTPPAFSTISADTQLKYLFPTGAPAKLAFEGEPATDAQNDPITYRFVFNLPNLETTDVVNDHIKVRPSEALFDVNTNVNPFEIEAASGATPHAFREAYGDVTSYDITVDVYANDGTADSVPISFILEAVYDPSARFQSPASLQSHNRWEITTPFKTYEGPGAASDIKMQWHASEHSSNRRWSAGLAVLSPVWCWDGTGSLSTAVSSLWPGPDHNPPTQNGTDNQLFSVSSMEDTSAVHPTGTVEVVFQNEGQFPDFENPHDADADNVYHLRIVNEHEITYPDPVYGELGCSGSAVDISIKVKDVGTPASITPTGSFSQTDQTEVNLNWTAPTGFIEGGDAVDFPHPAFKPSAYDYRHRPTSSDSWTQVTGATSTSATINGLTTHTLQVQVRATNSEGSTPWPDDFVTITRLPQASISAVNSSITEGSRAQFQVTLDRSSSPTVNLNYSWLGGHGSTTGRTLTFSDSNSQELSSPTTSTGTDGSITVTVASGTGYTIGLPSSATVTINRQVSPPSTPAAPSLTSTLRKI